MILRSEQYLWERKVHLEDLDLDMDQIRYDIRETEKQISSKQEERTSILEQLALTDYEAVKDRLDACISWLNAFPKEFQKRVTEKTQKTDEAKLIEANRISNADTIKVYEKWNFTGNVMNRSGDFFMWLYQKRLRMMQGIFMIIC